MVETDSAMAFSMILNRHSEKWSYTYILRRIRRLLKDTSWIQLIYKEENKVAGLLAKEAHSAPEGREFYRIGDLPLHIQKCIFIDRIGLPSFRPDCK